MTLGRVRRSEIVYFFEGFLVATHPTTDDYFNSTFTVADIPGAIRDS